MITCPECGEELEELDVVLMLPYYCNNCRRYFSEDAIKVPVPPLEEILPDQSES